jgi:hypothetical protein
MYRAKRGHPQLVSQYEGNSLSRVADVLFTRTPWILRIDYSARPTFWGLEFCMAIDIRKVCNCITYFYGI